MGRVEGKVALISGGARGMGAAHARALAAEGAKIVIGDILDEEGAKLAADLGADSARFAHLDVTCPEQWDAAVQLAVGEFGGLDVLVNNAGIAKYNTIDNFDLIAWQQLIDVNLTGTMLGMHAAVAPMKSAGGGSIINISSVEDPRLRRPVRLRRIQVGRARAGQGRRPGTGAAQHPDQQCAARPDSHPDDDRHPRRRAADSAGPGRQVSGGVDRGGVPGLRRVGLHDRRRPGDRRGLSVGIPHKTG